MFQENFQSRVSNGFDPGQDLRSVGPNLDPNCLQMSSAAGKIDAS